MTDTTRTAARQLHAAWEAASSLHSEAVRDYTYGTRTSFRDVQATLAACDEIWEQLLSLHNITEDEWSCYSYDERQVLWGF